MGRTRRESHAARYAYARGRRSHGGDRCPLQPGVWCLGSRERGCRRVVLQSLGDLIAENGISSSVIGADPAAAGSGSGVRWSKLLPPPAAAPRECPPEPSPPASPRTPSRIRSLATTSVMYFFWLVCLSSQERVCRRPSTYTLPPFFKYSPRSEEH